MTEMSGRLGWVAWTVIVLLWLGSWAHITIVHNSAITSSLVENDFATRLKHQFMVSNDIKNKMYTENDDLPLWIQEYKQWHAQQRSLFESGNGTEKSNVKFVVVVCLKETQCGGLADRIKNIPYFLSLAQSSNRVFLIHWTKGHALQKFWMPNGLDWTLPDTWLAKHPFSPSCLQFPHQVVTNELHRAFLTALGRNQQVVCVQSQFEELSKVRSRFVTPKHPRGAFGTLYNILFTPVPELAAFTEETKYNKLGLAPEQSYLAVHVRSKYPLKHSNGTNMWPTYEKHPALVQQWADHAVQTVKDTYRVHFSKPVPPIYVTSDNRKVVDFLKLEYNASQILGLPDMPRYTLEFDERNSTRDFFLAFFDLQMLADSECLSYGLGGFGRLGSFLSKSPCIIQHRTSKQWEDYW